MTTAAALSTRLKIIPDMFSTVQPRAVGRPVMQRIRLRSAELPSLKGPRRIKEREAMLM